MFKRGDAIIQKLYNDPKGWCDCPGTVMWVKDNVVMCEVFINKPTPIRYSIEGVRFDGEAYIELRVMS